MTVSDSDQEDHLARSAYVRRLVQRSAVSNPVPQGISSGTPRKVVQFWNDMNRLPVDVGHCLESWKRLRARGFDISIFDTHDARKFIANQLGPRFESAYQKCYHPAMQSDYFRLCYILVEGGCYVDADDVFSGCNIVPLFDDGRLKIQPLCYSIEKDQMIPPSAFTRPGANGSAWTFYFNNNPLLAGPGHPIVREALSNATVALETATNDDLPEIQSTTGPGNLTRSIFELGQQDAEIERTLCVLHHWGDVATSQWPLSYRNDTRNWRLSNCREYRDPEQAGR